MGISENNRTDNGQQHHQHRAQSSLSSPLDVDASMNMQPQRVGGQVHPSDWHTAQHQQLQHQLVSHTKFNSSGADASLSSAAQDAAAQQQHYMDVDQYEGGPEECMDERGSPVSPSAMALAFHEGHHEGLRASNAFSSSINNNQHPQHQLPSLLSHVNRFKATHGYARKFDDSQLIASSSSSSLDSPDASPRGSFSSTPTEGGGIRLPSLASFPGTPPLSPHRWGASPRAGGGANDAFPSPRRGFPLTASESIRQVFPTNNRAGFSSPSHAQQQFTIAPLRRGCDLPNPSGPSNTNSRTTTALPSLASLASSLPHPQSLADRAAAASVSSPPSMEDVGGPFQYQRAQSCPSDEYHRSFTQHRTPVESQAAPLYIIKSSVPKNNLVRSCSVDAETAFMLRSRSLLAPHPQEPEAIERWLEPERQPLRSLAESAHALQMLERSRSPSLSSGPSSPMSMTHGGSNGGSGFGAASEDESYFNADSKREKKHCSFPQCTSNAVTRGKCISHGGGRRCQKKGCTRGAQSKGLCVAHGGGRICRERGCSNIQRSMGLCIRHGGGKRCSMPGCQKGVVRQDLCTAHGGKRKCRVDDCTKHVKKKGLCRSHANSLHASN